MCRAAYTVPCAVLAFLCVLAAIRLPLNRSFQTTPLTKVENVNLRRSRRNDVLLPAVLQSMVESWHGSDRTDFWMLLIGDSTHRVLALALELMLAPYAVINSTHNEVDIHGDWDTLFVLPARRIFVSFRFLRADHDDKMERIRRCPCCRHSYVHFQPPSIAERWQLRNDEPPTFFELCERHADLVLFGTGLWLTWGILTNMKFDVKNGKVIRPKDVTQAESLEVFRKFHTVWPPRFRGNGTRVAWRSIFEIPDGQLPIIPAFERAAKRDLPPLNVTVFNVTPAFEALGRMRTREARCHPAPPALERLWCALAAVLDGPEGTVVEPPAFCLESSHPDDRLAGLAATSAKQCPRRCLATRFFSLTWCPTKLWDRHPTCSRRPTTVLDTELRCARLQQQRWKLHHQSGRSTGRHG
eukprot:TRINITY_DN9328_c0_g1_i1.p1 TRINITY_DN9328_c0_g1~~TRINITY_DN9328_c0_g1_i1.p1  ORF type:complete len:412 (+),score=15.49 TRINITY_DN9328_c0_g1_i1:75-1310(+)